MVIEGYIRHAIDRWLALPNLEYRNLPEAFRAKVDASGIDCPYMLDYKPFMNEDFSVEMLEQLACHVWEIALKAGRISKEDVSNVMHHWIGLKLKLRLPADIIAKLPPAVLVTNGSYLNFYEVEPNVLEDFIGYVWIEALENDEYPF